MNATATHVRIVNGGGPEFITVAEALAEMNSAMIGGTRKDVREMSASKSSANIEYRDGRKVDIRPATTEEMTAAVTVQDTELTTPQWRTLKGVEAPFLVHIERREFKGEAYNYLARDRKAPTGDPVTVVRRELRHGDNFGYLADGTEIRFNGVATKLWITECH